MPNEKYRRYTVKPLTLETMRGYFDAVSWGDSPDLPHAIFAYLLMDGYILNGHVPDDWDQPNTSPTDPSNA